MLKTIVDSYKMFCRNFPVILLYALPLLILTVIQVYFDGLNTQNRGVVWYLAGAVFLMPLISAATDIAVYKRLFKDASVNPFRNPKVLFIYLFVQLGLGLVAVLPIYLFNYILFRYTSWTLCVMCVSLLANMFIGVWLLARFNIILPLIVQQRVPSWRDFLEFTDHPYKQWLLVAFLVYMPYIVINYLFTCPYLNAVLTNLYMLVFVCFNTTYIMQHKMTPALVKSAEPKKVEPTIKLEDAETESKPKAKAKPQKAPAKKPAKKADAKPASKPKLEPALN